MNKGTRGTVVTEGKRGTGGIRETRGNKRTGEQENRGTGEQGNRGTRGTEEQNMVNKGKRATRGYKMNRGRHVLSLHVLPI